jgi:hypothetical protein
MVESKKKALGQSQGWVTGTTQGNQPSCGRIADGLPVRRENRAIP